MKLNSFIVRDSAMIGIRFEEESRYMDMPISNFIHFSQLEALNLSYLNGIRYHNEEMITLEELISGNKVPFFEKQIDAADIDLFLEEPITKVPVTLDFYREKELDFYDWYYNYPDKVLYVEGARQTGKTYMIERFIEKVFQQEEVYQFDLTNEEVKKAFQEFENRTFQKGSYVQGETYIERFLEYLYGEFHIEEAKLVYIDEIQESPGLYNAIRAFARKKKCRLIVSGSYLNLVSNAKIGENVYKPPIGGAYTIHLRSLNFIEFLQANGIINAQILFQSSDQYTPQKHQLFEKVSELYHIYLQIGGYPEVVKRYIQTGSITEATQVLEELMEGYFKESQPYLSKCNDMLDLRTVFESILTVLTNTNQRIKKKDVLEKMIENGKEKGIRLNPRDIKFALEWLRDSNFIGFTSKYQDLKLKMRIENQRCYFTDLGIVNYLAGKCMIPEATRKGYLAENFVYLQIRDSFQQDIGASIGYIDGQDAKLGNVELDFIYKDKNKDGFCLIEVKYGNSGAKSFQKVKNLPVLKSCVKAVERKTDLHTGSIPIFLVRFYCLLDRF